MNRKRWFELLNNLSETEAVSSELLAKKMNISSRTVRNELRDMKPELEKEGAQLLSSTKTGYQLQIDDRSRYNAFVASLQQAEAIPATSNDRIRFLLKMLLTNGMNYIKLEELCEQLYISRSRLTADLKEVRAALEGYNLKLVIKPGYGMRIEGDEFDVRLCLSMCMPQECESEDSKEKDSLKKIADCVGKGLTGSRLKLSDVSYQKLIEHIYIALMRIRCGNCIWPGTKKLELIGEEEEYATAREIARHLEEAFAITIPSGEVGYIAIHLAGKRIIENLEPNDNLVISTDIYNVVTYMLDEIERNYNISFHDDLELRMVLAMHLIPFSVRMRYGMNLANPMIKEIKAHYTMAYMIAITACDVLRDHYHRNIHDDEVGYFALHFKLALDRKQKLISKKNIVIVCSTGRGSAQLLLWKVKETFGRMLDKVETCDLNALEKYDLTDIDYVLTTVPISQPICRPILHIETFMAEKDINAIRSLLRGEYRSSLEKYFHPDLFLTELECSTKEEVIHAMVNQIAKVKDIPDTFEEHVLEREKMSVTAFGNMVAVPHPNKSLGEETFVCVAVLKKPIRWNDKKAQFIFMLSLKKSADEDMQYFFMVTSKLLFHSEYISNLIKNPSFSMLMKYLGEIEKEMREQNVGSI